MRAFGLIPLLCLPLASALPAPIHSAYPRRGLFDSIKSAVNSVTSVTESAAKGLTSDTPDNKAAPATLDPAQTVVRFLRPALLAQAAYCSTEAVATWKCGPPCDNLGKFEVLLAGGDNELTPRFFVAHDPTMDSIVIVHQGTDKESILSITNDLKFKQIPLNATHFPGAPGDVRVHDGFADAQGRTATEILDAVRNGMQAKNVNKVHAIGHSLGAAIAVMDAVMIAIAIPEAELSTTVFGLPRGGNAAWADLVDKSLKTFSHVTNKADPVPTVPPRLLDFAHPKGEVHIVETDAGTGAPSKIVDCPGRDNENCASQFNLLEATVGDHDGPWFSKNVIMAGKGCPL